MTDIICDSYYVVNCMKFDKPRSLVVGIFVVAILFLIQVLKILGKYESCMM